MATTISVDIQSRIEKLERDMKRANQAVARSTKGMRASFEKTGSALKRMGGAIKKLARGFTLLGAAATAALGLIVRNSLKSIDALAKTSDKLGIATESLQGFRHAAELTGVSAQTADMAMQRMVRRIAEAAQGFGEAQGALQELRLSAEALNKLSPDEQFQLIADAMARVESQADKVRLAMKLFDSEGVALVNTLALGSEGLREAQAELERMGASINRIDAAKVEIANDAMTRLGAAIKALGQKLTVHLAPFIAALADGIRSLAAESSTLGAIISRAFSAMNKIAVFSTTSVLRLAAAFTTTAHAVARFADSAVASFQDGFLKPVIAMINVLLGYLESALNQMIQGFNKLLESKAGQFAAGKLGLGEIGEVKLKITTEGLDDLREKTKRAVESTQKSISAEPIERSIDRIRIKYQSMAESIAAANQKGKTRIESLGNSVRGLSDSARVLKNDYENAVEHIGDSIADLAVRGRADFRSMINGIMQDFARSRIKEFIGALLFPSRENKKTPGGSILGSLGKLAGSMSSLFGGLFAEGGHPPVGKLSIVGEGGPEAIVPRRPTTVIPNSMLGAGLGAQPLNFSQTLNIQPGVSHQELAHILPMIENATIGRVQEMIARGGSRASAFAV